MLHCLCERDLMNRSQALEEIITFGRNTNEAYSELLKYSYDSDVEYFVVSKEIMKNALDLYLKGQLSAEDIEDWANFIECREDLDYEQVEDYIYYLANPVLVGEINKPKITKMVELLTKT